jgi:hypothetical protein
MKHPRQIKIVDKIPTGLADLQKLDEPTFRRRGIDLSAFQQEQGEVNEMKQKIDKSNPDKPAFLRKIMD